MHFKCGVHRIGIPLPKKRKVSTFAGTTWFFPIKKFHRLHNQLMAHIITATRNSNENGLVQSEEAPKIPDTSSRLPLLQMILPLLTLTLMIMIA